MTSGLQTIKQHFKDIEEDQIKDVCDQVLDIADIAELTQQQIENFIFIQNWINENKPKDYSFAKEFWQIHQQNKAAKSKPDEPEAQTNQQFVQQVSEQLGQQRSAINTAFFRQHAVSYMSLLKQAAQLSMQRDLATPKPPEVDFEIDFSDCWDAQNQVALPGPEQPKIGPADAQP